MSGSNALSKNAAKNQAAKELTKSDANLTWRRWLYHPGARAALFQTLLVLTITVILYSLVSNALQNLQIRGIATGFGFMDQTAGFGIGMSLIDYDSTHTYGRTFVVGLLNTALVAVLGIFFATILGFIVGVARLSNNWLLSRVASLYVEIFRNIPLLLQLLFWYTVVLQALPSARKSLSLFDAFFLNVRGFYLPGFNFSDGAVGILIAAVACLVAGIFWHYKAAKHQEKTGERLPTWRYSLSLLIVVPLVVFFALGQPVSLDYPALKGFNFKGGINIIPELFALLIALSINTRADNFSNERRSINT